MTVSTFSPAQRADALARMARGESTAKVAREIGSTPSTLRAWKARATKRGDSPAPAGPVIEPGAADDLLRRADEADKAERRTLRRVEAFLQEGDANAARAASQVARDHAARSVALRQAGAAAKADAARLAESETRVTEAQARMFGATARVFVLALGLGWSDAHEDLVTAAMAAIVSAEPTGDGDRVRVNLPQAEADSARAEVERLWRKQAMADARVELQEAEADALPDRTNYQKNLDGTAGAPSDSTVALQEPDGGLGDGLPPWDELPEGWKQRYAPGQRDLARWEYAAALRRRESEGRRAAAMGPRNSRRDALDFRHPNLRGL